MTAPDYITLCSIAGPILPSELRILGDEIAQGIREARNRGALKLFRKGYSPTQTPRLSGLKEKLTPALIPLLAALEEERARQFKRECEPLRGRMRQALVLGQDEHFLRLFLSYGGDQQSGWHPDRERKFLWQELLGDELEDSQLIPEGAARNDLFHHLMRRYSLSAPPATIALPTPPLAEHDRLNLALYLQLSGQADALPQIREMQAAHPDEDLLQALLLHAQGKVKEAQSLFKSLLGQSAHGALILSERKLDNVLGLAIDNAIAAKAGRAISECWINYAEYCLIEPYEELGQAEHQRKARAALAQRRAERDFPTTTEAPSPKPSAESQGQAIFWDIHLDHWGRQIQKLEARLLPQAKEGRSAGKLLSLSKLSSGQYQELCDADDAALLQHIKQGKWSYLQAWQVSSAGYIILAKHPRLRLVQGGDKPTRRALRLQLIRSSASEQDYLLNEQEDGSFTLSIPELEVAPRFDLHALLQFRAQELTLTLKGSMGERKDFLKRNSCLEQGHALATFCWRYSGTELALNILQHMQQSDIPLLWQGSKALKLHEARESRLSLRAEGKMGDWLKIGAELRVNEELVYGLDELLERWQNRQGNYVPLEEGHYLALSPQEGKQVALLQASVNRKAGQNRLPRAALPQIAKLWADEAKLSPKLAARLAELRHELATPTALPTNIKATLRPYQQEGFEWLAARARIGLGCCLADEMGLGKTLQILCLLQARAHRGASLIIAPLSLLNNWAQEAARFAPQLRCRLYKAQSKISLELGDEEGTVIIASYGQVQSSPELMAHEWDLLILDEAQALKNPRSQRSKAMGQIKAQCRIGLSATPIENHLLELWSLMNILNPGLLGGQRHFKQLGQDESGRQALRELIAPTILRRRKSEVMQELPELTESCVPIELNEAERALYESHRRHTLELLKTGNEANRISVLSQLTTLRRLCCHASLVAGGFHHSSKMDKLVDLVAQLREEGHRMLIFSQFTDVLQLARTQLEQELGAPCLYLDGKLSAKERQERVNQFQQGGEADCFLISLKAGGTGLNLTAADYVILLDPWWNPAIEQQALGRAHRMGQGRAVTLCRLICHNTVEEKVLAMHEGKQELADMLEELPQGELAELLA